MSVALDLTPATRPRLVLLAVYLRVVQFCIYFSAGLTDLDARIAYNTLCCWVLIHLTQASERASVALRAQPCSGRWVPKYNRRACSTWS